MDTSGRAVLFAGLTVIISLMGLTLVGLSFVTGVAIASAIGVAMMILAAMTLVPALLALVGTRIDNTSRAALIAVGIAVVGAIAGFVTGPGRAVPGRVRLGDRLLRHLVRRPLVAQAHPAPRRARRRAALLVPLEPLRPAPAMAEHARCRRLPADPAGDPAVLDPPRLRRPRQLPRRTRRSAGPTTCWPRASGPAATARSSSPSRATRPTTRRPLGQFAQTVAGTEGVRTAFPAGPPLADGLSLVIVYPDSAPQDAETTELVEHAARRRHPRDRARRQGRRPHGRVRRLLVATSPGACRSSSASCCCSASSC